MSSDALPAPQYAIKTEVIFCVQGVVSPLLANIYLHYVFDLWVEAWRRKIARGDMIVVRYADDLVVGFEHRAEAERFLREFEERLAKFRAGGPSGQDTAGRVRAFRPSQPGAAWSGKAGDVHVFGVHPHLWLLCCTAADGGQADEGEAG
jgi:hypothetical protein